MHMAKVSGQDRQVTFGVFAGAVPPQERHHGESVPIMPISALAAACRLPDYAESFSKTSAGGDRAVFSFGIIRGLPGRPTGCHPAGIVLA
jgi:hypothetical protein